MKCKNCGEEIPLRDEDFNEPEEGEEYFVKVINPTDNEIVTKRQHFFCSRPCLEEHEDSN